MKWWPDTLIPGDMIRVNIGSVKHYGIYICDDEVIQFGPPPISLSVLEDKDICVCKTSIKDFSCGNIIERAILDKKELKNRIPPEKTIMIAKNRLGEKGYSLLHNNCEHFAYECVFGKKVSTQEQEARAKWVNRPIMDIYIAPIPKSEPHQMFFIEGQNEINNTSDCKLIKSNYYDFDVLIYAANRAFGLQENDLNFSKTKGGKWVCDRFEFSVAHTTDFVIVGLSNGCIGVDAKVVSAIEYIAHRDKSLFGKFGLEKISDGRDDISLLLKRASILKCYKKSLFSDPVKTYGDNANVYSLKNNDDLLFCVCGDKINNIRFYWYEKGYAHMINGEVKRNEMNQ